MTAPNARLDPPQEFIAAGEIADPGCVAELFRRRFGHEPPPFPHHFVATHTAAPGLAPSPICYIHFSNFGGALLGGGACIDNRLVRSLPAAQRAWLRRAGGLYYFTLSRAVEHFAPATNAIFGYCGDALAERVDLAAGFVKTAHPHLLVKWTRELPEAERAQLIEKVNSVGPF